jgi:hypothetical protein
MPSIFRLLNFVWRSGRSACCRVTTAHFITLSPAREPCSRSETCDILPIYETGIPHHSSQKKIERSKVETCRWCQRLRVPLMQKKPRLSVSAPRWYSHHLRFLHWQASGRVWSFSAGVRASVCTLQEMPLLYTPFFVGKVIAHSHRIRRTCSTWRAQRDLVT